MVVFTFFLCPVHCNVGVLKKGLTSSPSSGYILIPILVVTKHVCPFRTKGVLKSANISSTTLVIFSTFLRSSMRIINSSPPCRASVSQERVCFFSLSVTSLSRLSPSVCPNESLIFLKLSRSRKRIAARLLFLLPRASN